MSDQFGTLRLPALEGQDADPLLDTLTSFLQAAVNADTKEIWKRVNPGKPGGANESLPIAFTFPHDPDETNLSEKQLPSLFAWRAQVLRGDRLAADWISQVSNIALLWIPPRGSYKQRRERQPYRNALAKAIRRALHEGRNPAWIVPGDTDPKAEDYGSLFLTQGKLASYRLLDIRPFDFDVDSPTPGDKTRISFDCMMATLEVTEIATPLLDDYEPTAYLGNTFALGGPAGLAVAQATFQATVTGVSPSSGTTAGGTPILVIGSQFIDGSTLKIGGAPATEVLLLEEGVLSARTPAGTGPGPVDVELTRPDGEVAVLAGGFTYV